MEVGDKVELTLNGVSVAVGSVFSLLPTSFSHDSDAGVDRIVIQVFRAIVPDSPLPYPNAGANIVSEAVDSFILWDKCNCKALGLQGSAPVTSQKVQTEHDLRFRDDCSSNDTTDTQEAEIPEELILFKNRKSWKGKKIIVLASGDSRIELAVGKIVYPDSSVCINGKAVGEENAGIMITALLPHTDPTIVQAQLPNYTSDQPHLCSWPIHLLKLEENGMILGDLYSIYADADFGRPGEQDLGSSQKRHYHSSKRKLLNTEEKMLRKMQRKGAVKLTDGSIRQAIAKGCGCPQQCWKKWSIDEIREERKDIYGVKHDQKLDLLFVKIDASKQRKDGMVLFKDGHFVCKKAFYNFHGIARSSFYAYKNGSEGGAKQGFHGNRGTFKPRDKTVHAFSAMKILLEEMSEPMPHLSFDNKGRTGTDEICHKLPSCYTRKDLYTELSFKLEDAGQSVISIAKFYTMWEKSFAKFSFHDKSAFAVCTKCEQYRTLLRRERNVELRKQYEGERESHLQLQMSGRTNYYSHNLLASSESNLFKSGIHDGMDSNKTAVPKLENNVKALSGVGMPFPVKIAGILNRGSGPPSCAHVCVGGLWSSDPNFTISSVARYLRDCENFNGDMIGDLSFCEQVQHPLLRSLHNNTIFDKTFLGLKKNHVLAEEFCNPRSTMLGTRPFTKLPPTFYIQLDNSGKDNKNWAVMAFLSELVARGVFKTIIASFLIVGHTHEDTHFSRR